VEDVDLAVAAEGSDEGIVQHVLHDYKVVLVAGVEIVIEHPDLLIHDVSVLEKLEYLFSTLLQHIIVLNLKTRVQLEVCYVFVGK